MEMCDAYQLRGIPLSVLGATSEFGRFLVSHAIVGSVADAVMVAVLTAYTTEIRLEGAAGLGYSVELTPRDIFLHKTQHIAPPKILLAAYSLPKVPTSFASDCLSSDCRQPSPLVPKKVSFAENTVFSNKDTRGKVRRWQHNVDVSIVASASNTQGIDPGVATPSKTANTTHNSNYFLMPKLFYVKNEEQTAPTQGGCAAHHSANNTGGRDSAYHSSKEKKRKTEGIRKEALKKAKLTQHPHDKPTDQGAEHLTVGSGKRRGRKRRAKPVVDDAMNSRIDQVILEAEEDGAKTVHMSNVQHYIDFFEAQNWNPLITDPLDPTSAHRMRRYIAYERSEFNNKGSSINQKLGSINQFHQENDLTPIYEIAYKPKRLLKKLKRKDAPAQPKLPVPKQVIDLEILEKDLNDYAVHVKVTAKASGLELCMRSKEYLKTEKGSDDRALKWKDLFFKLKNKLLAGRDVALADRMTASLPSTKNSLGRCTRTIYVTDSISSSVKLLISLYLRILQQTGSPPDPNAFVFTLPDGKHLSRFTVSKELQDTLESLGVPRKFTGSHSLRRGGANLYAVFLSDDQVKRFGRWESDAYKLYIHLDDELLERWMKEAAKSMPRFELN
jgi:hypothetical protein